MNKFLAFTVLALAAVAVSAMPIEDEAMTEAVFQTTDVEETAQLGARGLEAFNDFCTSSRDFVFADMKKQTGELSSKVYSLFFSSAAEIAKESLQVQNEATARLAAQLANPQAVIEEGADQIIVDGQEQIQKQGIASAMLTAFKTAVSAVSSRVGSLVNERIQYLKSFASTEQLVAALSTGCDQIASYEGEIREQFETYKRENLGSDAAKYASLKLDNVPCATSAKIIRSEGLCGLVRVMRQPIEKIWGTRN